jgi:transcription elongation factor S-II
MSAIMDQRELDSRVKALQKAIAEKEPASSVITIMETLKNNVNPTEELLRVCGHGMPS